MNEHRLAGFELGIIEQHVLHGRERDRSAGGVPRANAGGHRDHEPHRHIEEIAGKTIDVKTHHTADVLAQIVAAFAAGLAGAAGDRSIHDDLVADLDSGCAGADHGNLARRLGSDHERQLAFGKCHATPAPDIDVVERDGLNADLHLTRSGRRRRWKLAQLELAVGYKRECAHAPLMPVRRAPDR